MAEPKTIRIALAESNSAADATISLQNGAFPAAAAKLRSALGGSEPRRANSADAAASGEALHIVANFLHLAAELDRDYGADAALPLADAEYAVQEALRALGEIIAALEQFDLAGERSAWQAVVIGVGLWAMRHNLAIAGPEGIVNALAERANNAQTTQDTAATYALMQGFITHLKPQLGSDLERSNPERPWRMLNLNFAITAIRSGDAELMRYAFGTLNEHLPDESAGFYQEAYALASQPGFPAETRGLIEAEMRKATHPHNFSGMR